MLGVSREFLDRKRCVVVAIDLQEKLLPAVSGAETVVKNARILLAGARALGLPTLVTEQYPKGLGRTVPELAEAVSDAPVFEKLSFSCAGSAEFLAALRATGRTQTLLCGVETHVCVQQTVLDLLREGFVVHLAADASASRNPENRFLALERLRAEGTTVTSVESALFELLRAAGTEEFKLISKLVR